MVSPSAEPIRSEIIRMCDRRRKNKRQLFSDLGFPPVVEEMSNTAYLFGALDALVSFGIITRANANEIMKEVME